MPEMNKDTPPDSHLIEKEHSGSPFDDGDMTENMAETKGNVTTLFRYMGISFVIGTLVFIVIAFSLDYFLTHYGSGFFKH